MHEELNRYVSLDEYNEVFDYFKKVGLHRFEDYTGTPRGFIWESRVKNV